MALESMAGGEGKWPSGCDVGPQRFSTGGSSVIIGAGMANQARIPTPAQ